MVIAVLPSASSTFSDSTDTQKHKRYTLNEVLQALSQSDKEHDYWDLSDESSVNSKVSTDGSDFSHLHDYIQVVFVPDHCSYGSSNFFARKKALGKQIVK